MPFPVSTLKFVIVTILGRLREAVYFFLTGEKLARYAYGRHAIRRRGKRWQSIPELFFPKAFPDVIAEEARRLWLA
jgi:hypothetical protein